MKKETIDNHVQFTIDNTYEEWTELKDEIDFNKSQLLTARAKYNKAYAEDYEVNIVVNLSCDRTKSESDFLLLSYFFPIADDIMKLYKLHSYLIVNLVDEKDEGDSTEVSWKVKHLMCIQLLRETITLKINSQFTQVASEKIENESALKAEFNNIIPIIPFTDIDVFNYKKAFKSVKQVYSKSMSENTDSITKKDDLGTIYAKFFAINVHNMYSELRGTIEYHIKAKEKRKIVNDLEAYIYEMDFPIIAAYIWSVLVRRLIEKKLLIRFPEKKINWSMVEKAQYEAMSYAEGIYQLIENAILHSEGRTGYLNIRIHDTDREGASDKELISVANRIYMLKSKYKIPKHTQFSETFYIEIGFVDNTFNYKDNKNINMLDKANMSITKFNNLEELFERKPNTLEEVAEHYGLRVFEKNVLLNKGYFQVRTADGHMYRAWSIDKASNEIKREVIYPNQNELRISTYAGSDYNILLPIYNEWEYLENKEDLQKQAEYSDDFMFELDDLDKRCKPYAIRLDIAEIMKDNKADESNPVIKKKVVIEKITDEITRELPQDKDRIIFIYPQNMDFTAVELLAKAIYSICIDRNDKFLAAIYFENKHYINEFVRMQSIFYDNAGKLHTGKESIDIGNVQIALCGAGSRNKNIPEVKFVLHGYDLNQAQKTARAYAYYNSEASLEYIHTVQYLTKTIDTESDKAAENKSISIYPFDVYLDIDVSKLTDKYLKEYNNSKPCEDDIWFLKHIQEVLNTDMREKSYGCKIGDIHISIGSKIHIDSFYNAELLFHNYGNICRFAYMIAQYIWNEYIHRDANHGKKVPEKLCLIAYEEYSFMLISQVKRILKYKGITVEILIFSSPLDENETDDGKMWKEFSDFMARDKVNEYKFHIILPIATTLTTIYKIRNIINIICSRNKIEEPIVFGNSMALIVAGGIEQNSNGNQNRADKFIGGKELGFWSKVEEYKKEITLSDEYKNGGEQRNNDEENNTGGQTGHHNVRYYLNPACTWYKSISDSAEDTGDKAECSLCEADEKCLIGVDRTLVIPQTIFELFKNRRHTDEMNEHNVNNSEDMVNELRGCVKYSHLKNEQNHFQYSIDYDKYCRNDDILNKIVQWLGNIRKNIDVNAFNIIISPLERSNSIFLDKVITHAFESNVRLLHIDINMTFKENMRTKFSYITEEYNRIKDLRGYSQINVYYVDDCIVSGKTMQRGKQFMHMLLPETQADLNKNNVIIYKSIIVLANRSSYDTIQNIMPGRVKSDFFAFMRLNVPSYNTHNGVCPSCVLSAQYDKMHKRSASYEIADEYVRLKRKHSNKTLDEHRRWINNNILSMKSYEERFKRWLYHCDIHDEVSCDHEKVLHEREKVFYINALGKREQVDTDFKLKDIYQILSGKNENKGLLKDLKEYLQKGDETEQSIAQQKLIDLVKRYVVAERDFIRMKSTHNAFQKFETVMENSSDVKECEAATREIIIKLLQDQFSELEENFKLSFPKTNSLRRDVLLQLKAEWIISYVKILSRNQLSQYYHVKNVIYSILKELADALLENCDCKPDLQFIVDICKVTPDDTIYTTMTADLKMCVMSAIIRRLSAMHSGYVIRNIDKIYQYYDKCKQQYDGEKEYSGFYLSEEIKIGYKKFCEFTKLEKFHTEIAKLAKWSSMAGCDESKCFGIEQKCRQIKYDDTEAEKSDSNEGLELAFLENDQIIYNGIVRIMERCKDKKKIKEHVSSIYESTKSENEYYPMSTHKPLFSFMDIVGDKQLKQGNDDWVNLYTAMCSYYECLKKIVNEGITDDTDGIDSPYKYEELCNHMRDITGYNQCRIVCKDNGRVYTLVSSDIYEPYFRKDIIDNKIEEYIDRFEEPVEDDSKSFRSINKVIQKHIIKSKAEARELMMIKVELGEKSKLKIYIMLYRSIAAEGCNEGMSLLSVEDIWRARNLLFMRDHLETSFGRDIISLQDMVHSYNYVSQLSEGGPNVLHISDLHICVKSKLEDIKKSVDALKVKPDLIVISGDVIQGSFAASGIEVNYKAAAEIIKYIAKAVWEVKDNANTYIRRDWKKRIVISTGNHDYASMNELEAQNELRATASGKPSNTMGSTMIKYSYYIHFLHLLLDIDIDEAVKYDLNFFIDYEKMKITVVNINSNSRVNPCRTNKVGINRAAIDEICRRKKYRDNILFVMHHTPIYEIDYISDAYFVFGERIFKQWSSIINSLITKTDDLRPEVCWLDLLKAVADDFDVTKNAQLYKGISHYRAIDRDRLEAAFKEMLTVVENEKDKEYFEEKKLYEFKGYINVPREERDYNDRCQRLRASIREKLATAKADSEQYNNFIREFFTDLQNKTKNPYWILGGHTHRAAKFVGQYKNALKNCRGIIEAGKFYTGTTMSYVSLNNVGKSTIIEISPDKYEEITTDNNSTIRDIMRQDEQ